MQYCVVMGYLPFTKQALIFTCLQDKSFENTVKLEALERLSLHRPDFSVTMKRRFKPLSKEHYSEVW